MIENRSIASRVFDIVNVLLMTLLSIAFLYPLWYCLAASLSNAYELFIHSGLLIWPLKISLKGYEALFKNPNISIGYINTLIYVSAGTAINITLTCLGAYALSRRNLMLKGPVTLLIVLTMYFSGGLIPNFLVVRGLGLYNTRWAILLPGAIGTWNMIVMRTSFRSIPASLEESTFIDGANDFVVLFRITMRFKRAQGSRSISSTPHWVKKSPLLT